MPEQTASDLSATSDAAQESSRVLDVVTSNANETVEAYNTMTTVANDMVSGLVERLPYFFMALVVFIIFWIISIVFKNVIHKVMSRSKGTHHNLVKVFERVGGALILFFGFMVAMVVAIPGFTPAKLIGALGIGSVAIGFAFKDIFQNLLSGILLLLSEPFRIGDEIIADEFEGTVEDIKIRATTIRTYDGRRVVIPNSLLFTNSVTVNTAYKQRRLEIEVGIGYDDDINIAKKAILLALEQSESVSRKAEPSVIATAFGDSSINLLARWYIDDGHQSLKVSSIHEVIVNIKSSLDNAGVSIPFPIRTLDLSDGSAEYLLQEYSKRSQ